MRELGRKVLKVFAVCERSSSKELIAASFEDWHFLPLNKDLSISRRRLRGISDPRELKDSNIRLEIEIEKGWDATIYRVLRRWDARRKTAKISDPAAPLEERIDVSPSVLFTRDEWDYSGISFGHPAAYALAILVPALTLLYTGRAHLEIALAAFVVGALLVLVTFDSGDRTKTDEIREAKDRARAAQGTQFRQAARRIEWWKSLSGVEFESAVATLFCDWGYEVESTPYSSDGGIDLILTRNAQRGIVQCKAHERRVGVAAVRELIGARAQMPDASEVWLVSLFGFSRGAIALASERGIKLYSIAEHYLGVAPP